MAGKLEFIIPVSEASADLAQVGGKGASLARMAAAGLPVPPGFHITTTAYRRFVAENRVRERILATAAVADPDRPATLEEASARIGELFVQSPMPAGIAGEIRQAYAGLGADDIPVAVRSSATAEDLPEASFAGQQDTYLNITGAEAVLEAVKKCWASLWTGRAIAYRLRQGIPAESVALAVVVQELVPAEAAGVLFTANPLSGRRDEMVINAAWGLGEAVVGGRVTPDTIIADKASGRIKRIEVGGKTVMTVRTARGTVDRPVEESKRHARVLDDAQVADLVELGRRIEGLYGAPQDVEWGLTLTPGPSPNGKTDAIGRGEIVVLQSRPITTLFPLPTPLPTPEEGLRVYLCENVALQGITEPFTPAGFEGWRLGVAGMVDAITDKRSDLYPPWIKNGAGRLYVDCTLLVRDPRIGPVIAMGFARKEPVSMQVLVRVRDTYAVEIHSPTKLKLTWPMARNVWANILAPALSSFLAPRASREKMHAMGDAHLAALEERAGQLDNNEQRLQFVEEAGRGLLWRAFGQVEYCYAGYRSVEIVPALLKKWIGADALAQPALQALPYNPTTEMGQELLRIARTLQVEGTEPTADHPLVKDFLRRYGHRAMCEIDLGLPRWSEDPTYVVEMLRAYMAQDNLEAKSEQFRGAQAAAEAAIPRVVAEVRRRKGPVQAWLIGYLLRCHRELGGLRELPKFDLVRVFALFRRVLFQVGQELVAQGRLDRADDVFYLTLAEIRGSGDLRALAAQARADYRREVKRGAVPRVMTSTGECFYGAPVIKGGHTLVGVSVSTGVYEGLARIAATPTGAQLRRGEILVTRSTDPSWTPLFLNAGAVIMETGGPISHGAIVAREYGIPAVAGVTGATTRLHTGQRLRVNGETGEVTCLD